jgi:hypothetical protein
MRGSAPKISWPSRDINTNRLNFLLQIGAVQASVEASRGRGHHNKFSLLDALVASLFDKLIDGGVSAKRVKNAIGSELYAIGRELAKIDRIFTPHYLLIVEPRPAGRLWRCELKCVTRSGSYAAGTSPSLVLQQGGEGPTVYIRAFSSARSHMVIFPIGALWLELQAALKAELSPRTFCTFRRELSSQWRTAHVGGRRAMSSRVERRKRTADDHVHVDDGPSAAALRPAASESRPTHRGRDHRHGSRGPALDGPWVARQRTKGRRKPGRDEPEDIGTPARSRGAPTTREEAHGTPSARSRRASKLGIHVGARASARRTRQSQDPASRGSCPCVCSVAGAAAVPAIVAESVPCLATAATRVCA